MRNKLASQLPTDTVIRDTLNGIVWTRSELYGVGVLITDMDSRGEMDVIIDVPLSGPQIEEMLALGFYNLYPKFTDDTIGRDYEVVSLPPLTLSDQDILDAIGNVVEAQAQNQIDALKELGDRYDTERDVNDVLVTVSLLKEMVKEVQKIIHPELEEES